MSQNEAGRIVGYLTQKFDIALLLGSIDGARQLLVCVDGVRLACKAIRMIETNELFQSVLSSLSSSLLSSFLLVAALAASS